MALSTPQSSTCFLTGLTNRILRQPKAISFTMTQLLVIPYAFTGRSRDASSDVEGMAFSYHQTYNFAAIVGGLCVAIVMEALPVHFLFSPYSPTVAWLLNALDVYFGLWLLGNLNAMRLRPILLEDAKLHIRMGLFSQAVVALESIEAVHPPDEAVTEGRDYVNMATFLFSLPPNLVLTLKESVRVRRFDRFDKKTRKLGLLVDDARSFERELRRRIELVPGVD
jgi:hypothetical protein